MHQQKRKRVYSLFQVCLSSSLPSRRLCCSESLERRVLVPQPVYLRVGTATVFPTLTSGSGIPRDCSHIRNPPTTNFCTSVFIAIADPDGTVPPISISPTREISPTPTHRPVPQIDGVVHVPALVPRKHLAQGSRVFVVLLSGKMEGGSELRGVRVAECHQSRRRGCGEDVENRARVLIYSIPPDGDARVTTGLPRNVPCPPPLRSPPESQTPAHRA